MIEAAAAAGDGGGGAIGNCLMITCAAQSPGANDNATDPPSNLAGHLPPAQNNYRYICP